MTNTQNIINFFNEKADEWDKINESAQLGANKIAHIFSEYITDKSILDVGCGTGVLIEFLQKLKAKDITGIDISKKMIEIAANKHKNCEFICNNIIDWKTPKKFDTIIMYNCYPHLDDKLSLVEKIYNLLNPDGVFIVAHGASKEVINSHHQAHALKVSTKLNPAKTEAEIWLKKFIINSIRDDDLYYFAGKRIN